MGLWITRLLINIRGWNTNQSMALEMNCFASFGSNAISLSVGELSIGLNPMQMHSSRAVVDWEIMCEECQVWNNWHAQCAPLVLRNRLASDTTRWREGIRYKWDIHKARGNWHCNRFGAEFETKTPPPSRFIHSISNGRALKVKECHLGDAFGHRISYEWHWSAEALRK